MNKESKIYIAGHTGLVGSAILRNLKEQGYNNIVFRSSKELDLRNNNDVDIFFKDNNPEYVFLSAAKVGGIMANSNNPVEFLIDNLAIQNNIISCAYKYKVKKLLFLGSSCIYPKFCEQPIREEYLLNGKLEPTNEAYALAKISGLKLCQYYRKQYGSDFISAMPTNVYGINDNFDINNSHVIPGIIYRMHYAKIENIPTFKIWGTGSVKREFIFVDDLAEALVYLMKNYSEQEHINIGVGYDISILELVQIIKDIIGYKGSFEFDISKPDGTPRKLLDITKLNNTGYKHKINLREGIEIVYKWFLENKV